MKVSIVILNWNQPKLTSQCVESVKLLDGAGSEVKIIVVDNGSTDDSRKVLESIDGVELVLNHNNLGFSGGNNLGINQALKNEADYVLVLNNDTYVDPKLLKNLIKATKKFKAGAVSPKIYFAPGFEFQKGYKKDQKGKVIWSAGGNIDWNNIYGKNRGVDEVDRGQYDLAGDTDFATGAAVLYSAEAIREVGMFDEKYFLYLEDVDLSVRMKKTGWKIIYEPSAVVWHKVAQSSAVGSDLNDYYITRNRLLFGFKYAPLRTKFALVRESLKFLLVGRKWQKVGIADFYTMKFGKGSWQ